MSRPLGRNHEARALDRTHIMPPQSASQALGTKMEFESITEEQAKKILSSDQGAEVDEGQSLVRQRPLA